MATFVKTRNYIDWNLIFLDLLRKLKNVLQKQNRSPRWWINAIFPRKTHVCKSTHQRAKNRQQIACHDKLMYYNEERWHLPVSVGKQRLHPHKGPPPPQYPLEKSKALASGWREGWAVWAWQGGALGTIRCESWRTHRAVASSSRPRLLEITKMWKLRPIYVKKHTDVNERGNCPQLSRTRPTEKVTCRVCD